MPTNALGTFLQKFRDWKFCPPSDHLWTVHFTLSPRSTTGEIQQSSLGDLYNNIISANTRYDSMYSPIWKIDVPNDISSYMGNIQDSTIGMFLASDVSFSTNKINSISATSESIKPYSGWLSYGKIQAGRDHTHTAKIKFFKSNWDISEIFFDRWIGAIGQQGLIEDETLPNLKANIIINEYACSAPAEKLTKIGTDITSWLLRKTITLSRAFPTSRDQTTLSYEDGDAGKVKYNNVDFDFDSYQIKYADLFNSGYPVSQ